ncbi:alpha-(1,3)-fucosyltransferase 9-like [Scleropages formosus]|uniref:Fucosyltransferase n=1 Tax=Scleropages formosus TaxID=113540 RepID=A0A8C9SDC7_SCLFO|nr:alpha-(1,3)-fucosyltransferase 9-like [Scleropages formosus]
MFSTFSSGMFRLPVVVAIALGALAIFFLVYFKQPETWFSVSRIRPPPPAAEKAKLLPTPAITDPASQPVTAILLIWMWPFGYRYHMDSCKTLYGIDGCHLTDDRSMYNRADGVIFHHRDISGDLSNLPQSPRPPFQKWVWMNMESPSNSRQISALNNLINLTVNYRQDATVFVPYGFIVPSQDDDFVLPNKSKLVCWVVSNWNSNYDRVKYYNELKNHIEIYTAGNAFQKPVSHDDLLSLISSCKFYLSFENSVHQDYVTEKLYNPLVVGTVPIVLGPSRQNYENFVPGDAFIHVKDFFSPKDLAGFLLMLDKNDDMYHRYFLWRKHYKAKLTDFGLQQSCYACDYLSRRKEFKTFNNLDKWYWG